MKKDKNNIKTENIKNSNSEALELKLKRESLLVRENSMKVLKEFEQL